MIGESRFNRNFFWVEKEEEIEERYYEKTPKFILVSWEGAKLGREGVRRNRRR